MNILVTANTFSPCCDGVAGVVGAHTEGFIKAGHHVTVATQYHPQRNLSVLSPNLTVRQFKVRGNRNLRVGLSGEINEYQRFIADCDADIAFFHCWEACLTDLAIPLLPRLGFKKVLVSHGVTANTRLFWPRGFPTWLGWRPYLHWGIPRALPQFDRVVYLSDQMDNDRFIDRHIANRIGVKNGITIPNGADLKAHEQAISGFRTRYGIGEKLMLLCVGKYDKYKNEFSAVEAVLRSNITDAALVLIGPEINDYARRIQSYWEHHAKPGLRLLCLSGLAQLEILSAYKEADIFVQASRTECFPLVTLDAMASCTAFVSTDVGCVRELAGGVVVKGTQGLADAIYMLAKNPARRRELAEAGRRACESQYSWNRVWAEYESLLDTVMKSKLCA